MAGASWEGSSRAGNAVGTEAGGAGASARRDQRGPLRTVPLTSQPARSGRAPWLRRRVWSMLGSGSPRRGRGRQSPRAPSHARAAALLSRPGGGWRITPGPEGSARRSKGWSARGDERQKLCRPEPDLHPTLGCQPRGAGSRCQRGGRSRLPVPTGAHHSPVWRLPPGTGPFPPVLGPSVLQSREKCG